MNKNEEETTSQFSKLNIKSKTNKVPCKYFSTPKGCQFKEKCTFLHDANVKFTKNKTSNFKNKSILCKNFETEGTCKFGEKCNFAHGAAELKPLYRENSENQSKSSIIYLKHAETVFNLEQKQSKGVLLEDEKYLDCNELIYEEKIKELAENLHKLEFTYVFTSPLYRGLSTVRELLKNHPNKSNIKVLIHPYLTEHISGSQHNFCKEIEKKRQEFTSKDNDLCFDWKFFDSHLKLLPKSNENMFLFDFIDNKKSVKNYNELYKKLEKEYNYQNILNFLKSFSEIKEVPESFSSFNLRCQQIKKVLKEFVSEAKVNLEKEKILVVTDSSVIKLSSSNEAKEKNEIEYFPHDCIYPKFTDLINIDLD